MIALIQRVTQAQVAVDSEVVGAIEQGVLALVAAEKGDGAPQVERLSERLLNYRIFADQAGKMNLSVEDIRADLLIVPQFTLAADTRKGNRPSFSGSAPPEQGQELFKKLCQTLRRRASGSVASGVFGADMQVTLTNDGPVTFWLRVPPADD
ncbi:D-tyrosyl-tRNA(Tyr) deacylase [Halorhodospira halochloris]|uniref:D-aminoacyl-tRNA deacylase n=1 Tax=Halorhodospira halochloris TaxID=1052 RepID=A0A110B4G8_HALHR|nr:D-aminoacyl-tRNA deacylase [Halorhodospira halochloris]MBK1650739.1 D-tyrosyl-tRNA(Tyr) deacylase [Halorhodospira halochloris]BAU56768.1 D-tyrosyl-tRNA(Tyr) deacylase [Halorhodospira halochloris]